MTNLKTAKTATARTTGNWQGMNWIAQQKRLAIYLRDGMACAWCGKGVEDGIILSLDHLKPHHSGGSNHESNLVTCCKFCNTSRNTRTMAAFAKGVATYVNNGVKPEQILRHVRNTSARSLAPFVSQAKGLIERRGSVAKVMAEIGYKPA